MDLMTRTKTKAALLTAAVASLVCAGFAQNSETPQAQPTHPAVHSHRPAVRETATLPALCAACVKSNLSYLAGPELHGRGSGV